MGNVGSHGGRVSLPRRAELALLALVLLIPLHSSCASPASPPPTSKPALPDVKTPDIGAEGERRHPIRWRAYTVPAETPLPQLPKSLRRERYTQSVVGAYLVQFAAPVTEGMKAQVVEAGGKLLAYVPDHTYLVQMDAAAYRRVRALSNIVWIGVLQPAWRLSPQLRGDLADDEDPAPPGKGEGLQDAVKTDPTAQIPLTILAAPDQELRLLRRAIEHVGGTILTSSPGKRWLRLQVTARRDDLEALAGINEVLWIEPFTRPELHQMPQPSSIQHHQPRTGPEGERSWPIHQSD